MLVGGGGVPGRGPRDGRIKGEARSGRGPPGEGGGRGDERTVSSASSWAAVVFQCSVGPGAEAATPSVALEEESGAWATAGAAAPPAWATTPVLPKQRKRTLFSMRSPLKDLMQTR